MSGYKTKVHRKFLSKIEGDRHVQNQNKTVAFSWKSKIKAEQKLQNKNSLLPETFELKLLKQNESRHVLDYTDVISYHCHQLAELKSKVRFMISLFFQCRNMGIIRLILQDMFGNNHCLRLIFIYRRCHRSHRGSRREVHRGCHRGHRGGHAGGSSKFPFVAIRAWHRRRRRCQFFHPR